MKALIFLLAACQFLLPKAVCGEVSNPVARTLRVSLVQTGLEATLEQNRDKIIQLAGQAAAGGARVVIFPEGALASPEDAPNGNMQAALEQIAQAAKSHNIYLITGVQRVPEGKKKAQQQLYVFSPAGEPLLTYDKVWHLKPYDVPKMVAIDGVLCSFILCADRWSRPVESLPPTMGARIIIECSNNFDTEWIPSLQWYWYVPRAIRNTAFVIFSNGARENRRPGSVRGHGHSAIVAPTGIILAAAGEERDKIITADLDLAQATLEMAMRRSQHPLFKEWWQMGRDIYAGKDFPPNQKVPELVSTNHGVKCGFGLMACAPAIKNNVQTLSAQMAQAAAQKLDLVVFPELALTGNQEEAVRQATPEAIDQALVELREAAAKWQITAVIGAPGFVNGRRRNSAYVIGPDGSILTRYDQIVVSRTNLFDGGMSTKNMWFQVKGVWSIVTIGDDALWTEIAELAAMRGARLNCHLRHDRNLSQQEVLLHDQMVANLAGFRLLTIVANPLHLDLRGHPDASFCLGSGIWDHLEAGDWCAVKTIRGRPWAGVFAAPRIVPEPRNPVRERGDWLSTVPRYRAWMLAGVKIMDSEK